MQRFLPYLFLCGLLLAPTTARAGVYQTIEIPPSPLVTPSGVKPIPTGEFRDQLALLFRVAIPQPESPLRLTYLKQKESLETRMRTARASQEDLINLGACLIRLGQAPEAVDVLTRAAGQDRRQFMVLGNLAAAYQLEGQLTQSLEYLLQLKA